MNREECLNQIDTLINCYLKLTDDIDYAYNRTISLNDINCKEYYELLKEKKDKALQNSNPELDDIIMQIINLISTLLDVENAFEISMDLYKTLRYSCKGVIIYLDENGVITIRIELEPRNRKEKDDPVIINPFICIWPSDEYYDEFIEKLSKPFDKYFGKGSKLILKK